MVSSKGIYNFDVLEGYIHYYTVPARLTRNQTEFDHAIKIDPIYQIKDSIDQQGSTRKEKLILANKGKQCLIHDLTNYHNIWR